MGPRHPRIRTFHGRHGRLSPRQASILAAAGRERSLAARATGARPLVLEVGCGYGEAAVAFARAHPDLDVLATDVHSPGVAHLVEQADREAIGNLFVERTDALVLLEEHIGAAALRAVHLFFPDPWPKARHHKRRFIRPDVLDLLADRMDVDAELLVATDVDDYAVHARRHLDGHPAFRGGRGERPAWRPVTRYEVAAREAGRTVVELRYERR